MKKTWVAIVLVVLVILLAWFLLGGGSSVVAPTNSDTSENFAPDGPVQFDVLGGGTNAVAVTEGKNFRIQNQEQLAELWELIYGDDAPLLPLVDFTREEVLAVFGGQKTSGGYDISVKAIVNKNGTRVVTIVHEMPGASCATTDAITSPFELVKVPVGGESLTHEDETVTTSCS